MKKKQLTYVLLPIVLGIWGYIFYKFFNDTQIPSSQLERIEARPLTLSVGTIEYTFTLLKKYRDPFLGTSGFTSTRSIVRKKQEPVKAPVPVIFPQLVYHGIVTSHENKKRIGMLMIDGQSHMMQVNEKIGEIQITGLYKDSIIVQLNKVKKTFRKHR